MKKSALLFILILVCGFTYSQKTSGKVKFEITYPDSETPKDQQSMLPKEAVMYFKGEKSRMETAMGMGMSSVTLVNGKEVVILMDMLGNKMAMKPNLDAADKNRSADFKIEYLSETNVIAGYPCKKAVIHSPNAEDMILWYTEELSVNSGLSKAIQGVKGFPMEFSMNEQGMSMKMTAVSVEPGEVEDALFIVPSDYKLMSKEDMQKMFQMK
ncbi:hypothetical protein BH11BAC2_BH11BAC2_13410 [soil metagenome]